MGKKLEINIGERFGKLEVIDVAPSYVNTNKKTGRTSCKARWLCKCDCGDVSMYPATNLRSGKSFRCLHCGYKTRPQSTKHHTFLMKLYSKTIANSGRGIESDLSWDEFEYLIKQKCAYCGADPSPCKYIKGTTYSPMERFNINGIDRLDACGIYTFDNCVPCCKICNVMKSTLSVNEFNDHIDKLSSNKHRYRNETRD